jgi:hypothetical protein
MLLQTSIFLLLRAAEQTGRMRLTVAAGLCGLLLSLVHTYDIISVSVVWLAYRAVMLAGDIRARRAFTVRPWVDMVTTAAITAPGVLTVYLQLHSNPVFAARANVETLSAGLTWVFAGYGLTLLLAVAGAAAALRARSSRESTPPNVNGAVFLAVWGIANVAAGYLPFPFQRKMLQGAHIPIALLAGIGAAWLLRASRIGVRGGQAVIASVGLTVLLAVTNLRFLLRDIDNYAANDAQTHQQRPYMQPGEIVALRWIERSTPAGAAIQPLPWLAFGPNGGYGTYDSTVACVAPGLTGRAVYCGHWGETPSFSAKLADLRSVEVPTTPDSERLALLRRMRVGYILFTQKSPRDSDADALAPMFRGHGPLPAYLKLVYSNADADVYRVDLPAT